MSQDIVIKRIINNPIDSNCYVIRKCKNTECLIVDPGDKHSLELLDYLNTNNLKPSHIILTHEHFDHISGVTKLREEFDCKIIASKTCSDNIQHPKKNLSIFYDQIGFHCEPADIVFHDEELLFVWADIIITLFKTPGHSEGSICVIIKDNLFTGDTINKGEKTITKLPGGNPSRLKNSISKILSLKKSINTVYPGHNNPFKFEALININQE